MEHPFISDLSEKTSDDLQQTIQDLYGKLNFLYRTQNQPLINQMNMILETYKTEYNKRMDDVYKKQNIQNNIQIK
jgi:hypothetical protein